MPPRKVFLLPHELARHNGADKSLPVYVAIRGTLYDVSARRDMYGVVGQGYNCFAGRDASFALAKHSTDEKDCAVSDISGLTAGELDALEQWEGSFRQKYPVAGHVVHSEQEKAAKTAEEEKRYAQETARLEQEKKTGKAKL